MILPYKNILPKELYNDLLNIFWILAINQLENQNLVYYLLYTVFIGVRYDVYNIILLNEL